MTEENNENQEQKEQKEVFSNTQNVNIVKYLVIFLAIFLGTFLAVYIVIDRSTNRLGFAPLFTTFEQVEKMFDDDSRYIENNSPAPVKIEERKDEYVVTVNLKAFDNNKDNIKIKIENNGIKIDGKYSKKGEKQTEERSFYQNVIFPQKIKENKTEEKQEKDKLIIHLPIEK